MKESLIAIDRRGRLTILRLRTAYVDERLVEALEPLATSLHPLIALDLQEVRFVGSAAMSRLADLAVAIRKKGYKLCFVNASPHHRRLFKSSELARYVPVTTEQEVVRLTVA